MQIELTRIGTGFTGGYCYTHARAALAPDGFAVMTTQKLRLSGCDVFYGLEMLTSSDSGAHWSAIRPSAALTRQPLPGGIEQVMCDATPMYHRATGKIILLGHDCLYRDDQQMKPPRPRHTLWSVFDREKMDFRPFRMLEMPDADEYFSCGNGSGQSFELPGGELLIPVYFRSRKDSENPGGTCYRAMVLRCAFDGENLTLLELGAPLALEVPRGFCEPSVMQFENRFFLCLRNDRKGYVSRSRDGLHYEEPRVLCFDDGEESGNYNTQQHWLTCGGKLFLVYTRRGANNDPVVRHRAPLFLAEFDPERMCLIRATEQIAVPERGARLGNFCCANPAPDEAWVVASEWMQTTGPDSGNWRRCMSYGSDNSIFLARVTPDRSFDHNLKSTSETAQ